MKYTDLCARLDYLSSPDAEHMPDGARLTSIIRCAVEAAAAIRELEAERDQWIKEAGIQMRHLTVLSNSIETAEARVAELEAERDEANERARMNSFAGEGYVFMQQRAEAAEARVAELTRERDAVAEAWEAFKAANTTDDHFAAVERLDALSAAIRKGATP